MKHKKEFGETILIEDELMYCNDCKEIYTIVYDINYFMTHILSYKCPQCRGELYFCTRNENGNPLIDYEEI